MDTQWSYEDWSPTSRIPLDPEPSKDEFKKYQNLLRIHTKNIFSIRYDPELYLQRAEVFRDLGYPELAAADAYKALLLCEAGLNQSGSPELGETVRIYHGMQSWLADPSAPLWHPQINQEFAVNIIKNGISEDLKICQKVAYAILINSLYPLLALPGAIKMCNQALQKFPGDEYLSSELETVKSSYKEYKKLVNESDLAEGVSMIEDGMNWGHFMSTIYPWTPVEMRTRDDKMAVAANEVLKSCSTNLEVRSSTLGGSDETSLAFGMFAKRRIRKGERVLFSQTPFMTSDVQTSGNCYNCSRVLRPWHTRKLSCCPKRQFCSDKCLKIADSYHKMLCGKDFDDIYAAKGHTGTDVRFYLRVLAVLVQSGDHPLKYPAISWMTPGDGCRRFSLEKDIIAPMRILQELGADIFDEKYEPWVLQTVWNRIYNNGLGSNTELISTFSVNPMYSFFNHSCDPNTSTIGDDTEGVDPASGVLLFAGKNIEEGEEVFVTYITLEKDSSKEERWGLLAPWMGQAGCRCKKCQS